LLHLAGHDDADPVERTAMEVAQESIVARLWTPELRGRLSQ
jgi:ssRNA-specific RNase YbeY (16S rRNA maturation enzyme)